MASAAGGSAAELAAAQADVARLRKEIEALGPGIVRSQMEKALAELEAQLGPTVPDLVRPLLDAGVAVTSPGDALALAVHCALVRSGLVCTAQMPVKTGRALPGFASPVQTRDVPADSVVPPNWKQDQEGATRFTYRTATRSLAMHTRLFRGMLVVQVGEVTRTGDSGTSQQPPPISIELRVEDFVAVEPGQQPVWRGCDDLLAKVQSMVEATSPASKPSPAPAASPAPRDKDWTTTEPLRDPLMVPRPRVPMPAPAFPRPGAPGYFDGDLFLGGFGGGGGLMGPDHPMFVGGAPLNYLPRPRFDPIGPGGPGGFPRPLPGQGPQFPGPRHGAPNHDHLRPPGFGDGGDSEPPPPGMFF
eukprot:CAMPEP_0118961432 /NCGR_PEP_ID=MMETSP1173-20130426/120_1 /TAXON_ID=1034831 /ORGANISM="Rhizochromulina marina cf, Strain CCMP1243" /LENGTH=358 /DNA_ID=CAMNT_0006909603 /DNA_START=32 /DNA_END=1108 /DNA_ORIENTATION=-